jgi:stage V sporulation protein G
MEITEVRIKLTEDSDDRLQAFCSITFDNCFVVRDLKIIEGSSGPFVAMPSRKLTSHCGRCGCKNHLRAAHCNQCGGKLNPDRATRDVDGRAKLYADIAHPINSECREMIQQRVIAEYQSELERSQEPGYTSRYDDDFDEEFEAEQDTTPAGQQGGGESPPTSAADETRQIEPAASEPRPPHRPAASDAPQSVEHRQKRSKGFGAGIFDE